MTNEALAKSVQYLTCLMSLSAADTQLRLSGWLLRSKNDYRHVL